MNTTNFIDLVAAGEASEAKDALNNLLSAKAFEALDVRKAELAQTIFNGVTEEQPEVETEAE